MRLCNPLGCGPPGSSVRGISQVRILEGVAIFSSMASSRPRDRTHVSCFGSWILYHRAIWEARWGLCSQQLLPPLVLPQRSHSPGSRKMGGGKTWREGNFLMKSQSMKHTDHSSTSHPLRLSHESKGAAGRMGNVVPNWTLCVRIKFEVSCY